MKTNYLEKTHSFYPLIGKIFLQGQEINNHYALLLPVSWSILAFMRLIETSIIRKEIFLVLKVLV